MRRAAVLGCLLLFAAGAPADEVDDVSAALTSGGWVKDLGNPKMPDYYLYTFARDGTYKSEFHSDFESPPTTGKWQLVKGKDGVHLRLKSQDGKYGWLAEDSVIRYDGKKDVLLISGPGDAGEVPLRRQKAK
jgi:hypothetical protein